MLSWKFSPYWKLQIVIILPILSLTLIGCLSLTQEYYRLIGWYWEITRRQLWTLSCPINNYITVSYTDIPCWCSSIEKKVICLVGLSRGILASCEASIPESENISDASLFWANSTVFLLLCLGVCRLLLPSLSLRAERAAIQKTQDRSCTVQGWKLRLFLLKAWNIGKV